MELQTSPERTEQPPAKRRRPHGAWLALLLVAVLVLAILLPPLVNMSRYKRRIADSIGQALGRTVQLQDVTLRLLPRPGFEITNIEIEEDPSIGTEPALSAPEVMVSLRLLPLWSGRLEVARISFDQASINIARSNEGRWNFSTLVMRAQMSAAAPTAGRSPLSQGRFPYIEATNSRVNFKQGAEKRAFSLVGADLALWLENPDEWRVRLEAQPLRTDLVLEAADTGTIELEGRFHRATELRQAPMVLHGTWKGAELGQFARLVAGEDKGWRGALNARLDATGSPEDAAVTLRFGAEGVHRQEFEPGSPLDFDASCKGQYRLNLDGFDQIACKTPLGKGSLDLSGSLHSLTDTPAFVGTMHMENLPAEGVLDLVRTLRSSFAPGMQATGSVSGTLAYAPAAADTVTAPVLSGTVKSTALELRGDKLATPLRLSAIELDAAGDAGGTLELKPVLLSSGSTQPLQIAGRLSRSGFALGLHGTSQTATLVEYTRAFGLLQSAIPYTLTGGTAQMDLQLSGPWVVPVTDPNYPTQVNSVTGTITLANTRLQTAYLPAPLVIEHARAMLLGNRVNWPEAEVGYGAARFTARLEYSLDCRQPDCRPRAALQFAQLDAGALAAGLSVPRQAGLLGGLLGSGAPGPGWPGVDASLEAAEMRLGALTVRGAVAEVSIQDRTLTLRHLTGETLGGQLALNGKATEGSDGPRYALDATLNQMRPSDGALLAGAQHWGGGTASLTLHLTAEGMTPAALKDSSRGEVFWDWRHGTAAGAGIPAELTRFEQWQGQGTLEGGLLTVTAGKALTQAGSRSVSGTIQLALPPLPRLESGIGPRTSTDPAQH